MARSRTRTPAATRGSSSGIRSTKATSRKSGGGEVEVIEEAPGLDAGDGALIITTILLIVAFLFVDRALGTMYGEGLFFK